MELSTLQRGVGDRPIVYAGDIFDKWNSPAELINFAIKWLPCGFSVPGQHDLPLHDPNSISKSAYWTLVSSHHLENLREGKPYNLNGFSLTGFPWGSSLEPNKKHYHNTFYLAVVHKYFWIPKHNPANKPKGDAPHFMKPLKGFNAAVFGDNHDGFVLNVGDLNFVTTSCINCGTFFRRRIDERDYRPMVGLLLNTGKIVPYYMDVSRDKFIEETDAKYELADAGFSDFVQELEKLESDGLDFADAMKQALTTKVSKGARKLILEALEGAKE